MSNRALHSTHHWLPTTILLVTFLITGVFVYYTFWNTDSLETKHGELQVDVMEIRLNAALLHLWAEESFVGDKHERKQVALYTDKLEQAINRVLVRYPERVERAYIDQVNRIFSRIIAIVDMRLSGSEKVTAGSWLDGTTDLHFHSLDAVLDRALQEVVLIHQQDERNNYSRLLTLLLFLFLIWGGAVIWVRGIARTLERQRDYSLYVTDQLKINEAKLLEAQHLARIGNWELDVQTMRAQWSDSIHQIVGTTPDQEVGPELLKSFVVDEDWPALERSMINSITQGDKHEAEYRVNNPNGEQYWLYCTADPELDDSGKPIKLVGVVQDITERKRQLQALMDAKMVAEKANLAKDEFLASMSHELRTPLTSIIGNSEYLLEKVEDQEIRKTIKSIEISGQNQLALVNDILDISRIESGQFTLNNSPYNLYRLINELELTFTHRAENSGLTLDIGLQQKPAYKLIGDYMRVKQVLINLLGNALKFTAQGGVTLNSWYDSEWLYFEVKDSGIGMSAEVLSRLFRRFEQADSSISREYGGSGLGLYISKNLVELMGGTIEVTSEPEKGSCFQLKIPCLLSDERVSPDNLTLSPATAGKTVHFKGEVLLVEDTTILQKLIKRTLEMMSVTVTCANNGKEALEAAHSHSFDLILMDMQMPVMDGVEATKRLRAENNQTPIIACTANVMPKHQQLFTAAGIDGLLTKPIDTKALQTYLRKYLQPIDNTQHSGASDGNGVANTVESPYNPSQLFDSEESIDPELMQEFYSRVKELKTELSVALVEEDWTRVRDIAHVLKGAGASFGYKKISQIGADVCNAVDNDQLENIAEIVMDLIFNMSQVEIDVSNR